MSVTVICLLLALDAMPLNLHLPKENDEITMSKRELFFPVIVDQKTRESLCSLVLYFSMDQGKTWHIWKRTQGPNVEDGAGFHVALRKDGLYWFAVQTITRDGTATPASMSELAPDVKIRVQPASR